MSSLTVETTRRYQALDITDEVLREIPAGADGVALAYLRHTTAALVLGPSDDGMLRDFERVAEHWLAGLGPFEHIENDNPNGEAHLLSAVAGVQILIPVIGGKPDLGTWQRILLLEMDGPLRRTVSVRLLPSVRDGPT